MKRAEISGFGRGVLYAIIIVSILSLAASHTVPLLTAKESRMDYRTYTKTVITTDFFDEDIRYTTDEPLNDLAAKYDASDAFLYVCIASALVSLVAAGLFSIPGIPKRIGGALLILGQSVLLWGALAVLFLLLAFNQVNDISASWADSGIYDSARPGMSLIMLLLDGVIVLLGLIYFFPVTLKVIRDFIAEMRGSGAKA